MTTQIVILLFSFSAITITLTAVVLYLHFENRRLDDELRSMTHHLTETDKLLAKRTDQYDHWASTVPTTITSPVVLAYKRERRISYGLSGRTCHWD